MSMQKWNFEKFDCFSSKIYLTEACKFLKIDILHVFLKKRRQCTSTFTACNHAVFCFKDKEFREFQDKIPC